MAFNVSYLLEAKDRFSGTADKVSNSVSKLTRKFDGLRNKVGQAGQKLTSLGAGLSLKVTAPLLAIAGLSLSAAARLETLQVAFESMTGSADKAKQVVASLVNFAAKTPFQLEGIGKAAKQLLSFGVAQDALESKLKLLGDIAAGANVPLSDMASIFGKVKAKGKAMTEEILQLSDRGIPIIDVISKKFGVAKDQVFKLASEGKISFGVIQQSLQAMTQKGGIFFDQMAKQSATLSGIWSTLKDNTNLALASMGAQIIKTFNLKENMSKFIAVIQRMTAAFNRFSDTNPKLARLAIILIGLTALLGPLAIGLGLVAVAMAAVTAPMLIGVGIALAIGVAIAALIIFWDDLAAAMGNVAEFWSTVFNTVLTEIQNKILIVQNAIANAITSAKGFFGFGDSNVNVNQNSTIAAQGAQASTGRIDGNITVNAPPGVVQKVESNASGMAGNLGLNMAGELG